MVPYGDWRSYYASLGSHTQFTAPVRYILNKPDRDRRQYIHQSEVDLKSMNRLLWEEHVNWTRMTIISIVFKLPDLAFVQERLLRNATDMGNCLRPFYGNALADQYAALIKEHLVTAAQLVTAAVQGDAEAADAKEKEWYRNADQIAEFLSRINPYIDREVMRQMLYSHLALTKNEAVWMIQKKFKEDVAVFDRIEAEALMMADYISSAMVAQFPYLFQ